MNQDESAIQRAVSLLSSNDLNENKNGLGLVINAAANANSVPKLLRANIVRILLPKLESNDNELLMKTCWALANLSVHEEGRNACQSSGILRYISKVLQNQNTDVINKACKVLMSLSRNSEAQREMVQGTVLAALVRILTNGKNDEEKGFALQPLCNLVLDAESQQAFKNAKGIPPTIRLLSSSLVTTQELAVTLVSFVTTNHDSIRKELIDLGALPPLCALLQGARTKKILEYTIKCLANLSHNAAAEQVILTEGAIRPIVGLLSSEDEVLYQHGVMLFSNLGTNKEIREAVRYIGWVDPLLNLVKKSDPSTLQFVLRAVINIVWDEHCRYMLQQAEAATIITQASAKAKDNTVTSLTTTALKNLSVPCPALVQHEVTQKFRAGAVERVPVPKIIQPAGEDVDLQGLSNVLSAYNVKPTAHAGSSGGRYKQGDDLDDLL